MRASAGQKQFLRWFAVLPGAILAGLLATFPLHWVLGSLFPQDGKFFLDFIEFPTRLDVSGIELTLSPLVISTMYIWSGAEIAPKYKLAVAIVLSVLVLCMMLYLFLSSAGHDTFEIKTAGALLGIVLGLLLVRLRTRTRNAGALS